MARVLGLVTRSAIHCNDSLSDVDKFSNLRGWIEGRAKASIAGFALTEATTTLLQRRFGKKIAIERAHISELLKVQPMCGNRDPRILQTFYDKVETHYRVLGLAWNCESDIIHFNCAK